MSEPRDMDAPVTRREMHEALETWAAVIIDKLTTAMKAMETRLMGELARATKGSEEELTTRIRVVDEQYTDLPGRVTRLEAKVFAPVKRARARARARKRS
jgi:hypothetical protein